MTMSDPIDTALTIAEAAALANRSTSWVRSNRDFGPLQPAMRDGRQAVTLVSLLRLLEADRADRAGASKRKRSTLRLVVDNTK